MKKIFYTVLTSLLLLPLTVSGKGSLKDAKKSLGNAGSSAGTTEKSLDVVVGGILFTALSFVGIIFLILMVYAGFLWLTAAGEESKIEQSQKIIRSSIIGLIVVMSAYAITALVTGKLGSIG